MLLSLLDRSRTRSGRSDAEALQATVRRARRAEELGLHRFWVAEHHAVPGVVGSAPTVTMAAVAAATSRVRVGTAGVMLPNHSPFVVAEQLATLVALHPGRVDVGVGRSLGFTAPVRRALGTASADGFEDRLGELLDWLHGRGPVTVRPRVPAPPVWLLATGSGLATAARFGLPVVVGGSLLADPAALQRYRERTRHARVTLALDVLLARDEAAARRELLPQAVALARSRSRGEFGPLLPPQEAQRADLTGRERADVERTLAQTVHGDEETVAARLADLVHRTGAVELLVSATPFAEDAEAENDTRVARLVARLRTGG
ncbi:MsnO8 family LLM class oxidoreductase [Kineococcus rhizosphaerae]|uniref:Luciferase family oxidoreductase group 1 n=1 Tax=Kineococcus rhizosphaerae TaxID=559628 RepID=A0A2T0R4X6_9ACTN|nr:MsnO8 family LLM class oxidoreductase [Kineococcus rhizosphaerae]PRY15360.1 luciferase family oxidoreductase group 1 [Kineococcus rhizosphaerae]